MGTGGDSFYEYLAKGALLAPEADTSKQQEMHRWLVSLLERHALYDDKAAFPSQLLSGSHPQEPPVFEHLSCFTPGYLALGSRLQTHNQARRDAEIALAEKFMAGCLQLYETPSGLGRDMALVRVENSSMPAKLQPIGADNYMLRPEVVESLFVLWRVTKKEKYREAGWKIFQSILEHCEVTADVHGSTGFSGIFNVENKAPKRPPRSAPVVRNAEDKASWEAAKMENWADSQPSFFLAETLKCICAEHAFIRTLSYSTSTKCVVPHAVVRLCFVP